MAHINRLDKSAYQTLVASITVLTESEQNMHHYILKHFDELP